MPNIDGKEYPRLENGVVLEAPAAMASPVVSKPATSKTLRGAIDLNSASAAELQEIKGIGAKVAQAIVDGAPYESLEDCAERVKGVSLERLQGADAYIGSTD